MTSRPPPPPPGSGKPEKPLAGVVSLDERRRRERAKQARRKADAAVGTRAEVELAPDAHLAELQAMDLDRRQAVLDALIEAGAPGEELRDVLLSLRLSRAVGRPLSAVPPSPSRR